MELPLKRIIFPLVVFVFVSLGTLFAEEPQANSTTTEAKLLADTLGWMMGDWDGTGTTTGGREFLGKLSVAPELDNASVILHRESMNKAGGPSGGLKEVMMIGYDGTTKKIVGVTYDTNYNISLYVGELNGDDLIFNSAVTQPGYVARRTFHKTADGINFTVETGSPGKEVTKTIEINFKKKS